jgi:hypothetical protein
MMGFNFSLYKVDKNRCVLGECPTHTELKLEEEGRTGKTGACVPKRCDSRVVAVEENMNGSRSCGLDGDEQICYLNHDGLTVCDYFFFDTLI